MILKLDLTGVDLSVGINDLRGRPAITRIVALINGGLQEEYTRHITGEGGWISWEGFQRWFREDGGVELLNYSKRAPVSPEKDIQILNEILSVRGNKVRISFSIEHP